MRFLNTPSADAASRTRLRRCLPLVALAACITVLALHSAPASAELTLTHTFKTAFGSFSDAGALAVDQETGDLYVIDVGTGSVKRFDATGNPVPFSAGPKSYISGNQLTGSPVQHFDFEPPPFWTASRSQVAIDNSGGPADGYIYVTDTNHLQVDVFDRSGTFRGQVNPTLAVPSSSVGQTPCGVAVSPSGDVYVSYHNLHVDRYTPVNASPNDNVFDSQLPAIDACNIAVDSTGTQYVIETNQLTRFQGAPLVSTALVNSVYAVAVDPSTDAVYADKSTSTSQFDFAGNIVGGPFPFGSNPYPNNFFIPGSRGIAVDGTSGNVYISSIGNGGDIYVFEPSGTAPAVTTGAASNVAQTTVTLHGHLDLTGAPPASTCEVVYGVDNTYGHSVPCAPQAPYAGSTDVTAALTDLRPGASYHYRLTASNSDGSGNGHDQSFSTQSAPTINAVTSSDLAKTSATLKATINPHGVDTTYQFEYGTTSAYGNTLPVVDIGSAFADQTVTAQITDLQAGVTYHFRVVAQSALGIDTSDDQTFSFAPPNCPNAHVRQQTGAAYLPDCRAYELVSPANAGGGIWFAAGPRSPYATDPLRLAFSGLLVAPPDGSDPINGYADLFVATRTDGGWSTKYVGLGADQASSMGGPPVPGYNSAIAGNPRGLQDGVLTDPSMDTFVNWDKGNALRVSANGTVLDDGNRAAMPSNSPYVWDAAGRLIDRWPTNFKAVPGGNGIHLGDPDEYVDDWEGFQGAVTASGDLKHFVFSSRDTAYAPNGLTTAPGSAYDNNVVERTVTKISLTPDGGDIQQAPGWGDQSPCEGTSIRPYSAFGAEARACEWIRFPGVETDGTVNTGSVWGEGTVNNGSVSPDGSHILMSTASTAACVQYGEFYQARCAASAPKYLYMRVNDAVTYDVSQEHAVNYVGMSLDASEVYFTSPEQLTSDDHDSSEDLFVWHEVTNSLTRISVGSGVVGDTDSCSASWISGCGVAPVSNLDSVYGGPSAGHVPTGNGSSDNSIASTAGDIYFYSPERLDGTQGSDGERNLYDYRNGQVQYVTTLDPTRPLFRMQVTPNDSHAAFLTATRLTGYDNAGHLEMYLYEPAGGKLRCVSCNPSGAAPTSDARASINGLFLAENGRTFFATDDGLDRRDTNRVRDVYEYVDGKAQLITTGTSAFTGDGPVGRVDDPGLISVSADGTDVYFSTYDTLAGQDRNGVVLKIYDARTNGGFPFVPPPPPCAAADECHLPGSSPPPPPDIGTSGNLGGKGNEQGKARKQKHKKRRQHRSKREARHNHG